MIVSKCIIEEGDWSVPPFSATITQACHGTLPEERGMNKLRYPRDVEGLEAVRKRTGLDRLGLSQTPHWGSQNDVLPLATLSLERALA